MKTITINAYAKINLGLDVIRKREDGYHDVNMIMQSVDLYDTLTISRHNSKEIKLITNLPYLPVDQGNIVYRAVKLFQEKLHIKEGVDINLEKKIPVAAGLAGGSSNAAAALKGLNQLFQTNLSLEALLDLGVQLGADVPYCLMGGTALSEGIGEILTPLPPMPQCYILLVKPPISVSTKYVYENLQLQADTKHPDIKQMKTALEDNNLTKLVQLMDNILETVTENNHPVITEIKNTLIELGALTALMSGSGPTVFGIFEQKNKAENAYNYFKNSDLGKQTFLTTPYWPPC